MKQFRYTIVVLALMLISAASHAQDYDIFLTLNGFEAGTGSPGVGDEPGGGYSGCYYNSITKELTVNFVFYGLSGTTTASHIHGPAAMFVPAPVIITLTGFPTLVTFGSYSGTFTLSATNEIRLLGDSLYVNIHTSLFPGGEIRGQLHNVGLLPVELTSFTAIAKGRGVELAWKTATEKNNHGFEIERQAHGHPEQVSPDAIGTNASKDAWGKIGFVEGHGTTNAPKEYSFTDNNISSGTYSYRLKQIDRDGKFEYSKEVEVVITQVPQKFALMQNYPNPFNPSTKITYAIPVSRHGGQAGFVSLKVYDVIGNEVSSLVNGVVASGEHSIVFNASNLAGGVYFYTLRTGDFSDTKKLVLLK